MAAWVGVCVLVLVAPFEALTPLVRLPGQSLSNVEVATIVALVAWILARSGAGRSAEWRARVGWPWLAVLLACVVAAWAAPAHRINAFHMTGRLAVAFGVFLLTVSGVTTRARLHGVLVSAATVGVVVAGLVVLERAGNERVLSGLRLFRPGVAVVGDQVRAGGPFQYPTIASMYLEIVFALTLGLLSAAAGERRTFATLVLLVALAAMGEAVALTFTRAGVLTVATSLVLVGALRWRRHGFDRGVSAVAVLAVIVAAEVASSQSVEAMGLRLTTETQTAWYRAEITAPRTLSMEAGRTALVPITIVNTGRATWDSTARPSFRLSYHWLEFDSDRVVVWEGARTEFPSPVKAGAATTIQATVQAPNVPGHFRALWDVEVHGQLWFSSEPQARTVVTNVAVAGAPVAPLAASAVDRLPMSRPRPGRLVLWRAAGRMFRAHPLTGIGPDNFRLSYGDAAGIRDADPRTHSNNMYLEMLVGTGLVGGLAMLWFGARVCGAFAAAGLRAGESWGAGVAAAGLAIAVHGAVDSFLSFTPTYLLMAVTIGLAAACPTLGESRAHRV